MDDEAIIDLFWQRSENAIRQTDIKYGALCTSLAGNILRNPSDTEECVNDSYLTVWNRIPEESLDAGELGQAISRFLRSLNKTDMRIFLRRYWYCDGVQNIVEDYGMNADKVSGLLYRTRKKLKKFLEKEGGYILMTKKNA